MRQGSYECTQFQRLYDCAPTRWGERLVTSRACLFVGSGYSLGDGILVNGYYLVGGGDTLSTKYFRTVSQYGIRSSGKDPLSPFVPQTPRRTPTTL